MNPPDDNARVNERIREFIARDLLYTSDSFNYSDESSFLQEGIIDSLGILQLVEFVQADFRVVVDQQEIIPENFDSVSKLAGFVRRKLQTRNLAAAK